MIAVLLALQTAAAELPPAFQVQAEAEQPLTSARYWPGLPLNAKYDIALVLQANVKTHTYTKLSGTLALQAKHIVPSDSSLYYLNRLFLQHTEVSGIDQNSLGLQVEMGNKKLRRGAYQKILTKPFEVSDLAYPQFDLGVWMFGISADIQMWNGEGAGGAISWMLRKHFGDWFVGVGRSARFEPLIRFRFAVSAGYRRR